MIWPRIVHDDTIRKQCLKPTTWAMSQPENNNTGNISAPQQYLQDMGNNKMGNV